MGAVAVTAMGLILGSGANAAQAHVPTDPLDFQHECVRPFSTPDYDNGLVTDVIHHYLEPTGLVTHEQNCGLAGTEIGGLLLGWPGVSGGR